MDGFWYCRDCKKPVALNVDGQQSRCDACGSANITFITERRARRKSGAVAIVHPDAPLPASKSATLFATLRAAVD